MAKPGPKPIITPDVKAKILGTMALVGTYGPAAVQNDVSLSTLNRARRADPEFDLALRDAVEKFKMMHLLRIATASKKDWNASKWLLERKFPDEFGRRNADSMSMTQVSSLVTQLVSVCFKRIPKKYFKLVETDFNEILAKVMDGQTAITHS